MVEGAPLHRRILVIDPDSHTRLIMCDRLLAMGFDVAGEDTGMSGLARVACEKDHAPFNGLVLELEMPVLGGMAILQEMKDRYPEIPVIVTCQPGRIDRLREAVKLGAKEYLVKPCDPELFRRKCRRVFVNSAGST